MIAKAVFHLVLLLVFSLVLLWLLFFFHGTGFNSLLIPDQLRLRNGAESQSIKLWYALLCIISYLQWFGLLWLVNRFNLLVRPRVAEANSYQFETAMTYF